MSQGMRRSFSRDFKLEVIERLQAGESGTALGLEYAIKRTIIYRWRDAHRDGGAEALRGKPGRPRGVAQEPSPGRRTGPGHKITAKSR